MDQFLRTFQDSRECICSVVSINFVWIVEAIQLFKISFVGLLKILLDIGKVNDIAISIILIWTINTSECLQKIMVFQLSTKIKSL